MNEKIKSVLLYICNCLEKSDLVWALTGSTNFNIQGIDIDINDIDVQTDENSAYKFEKIFKKHIVKPVGNAGESPSILIIVTNAPFLK